MMCKLVYKGTAACCRCNKAFALQLLPGLLYGNYAYAQVDCNCADRRKLFARQKNECSYI